MNKSKVEAFKETYRGINDLINTHLEKLLIYLDCVGATYTGFTLDSNGTIQLQLIEEECSGHPYMHIERHVSWDFITNTNDWLHSQEIIYKRKLSEKLKKEFDE